MKKGAVKLKGRKGKAKPKTRRSLHPLKKWRRDNRYTRPAFLKLLKKEGVIVSLRSLVYWEEGKFRPRGEDVVEAIQKVTDGEVKPESFLES